MSVPVALPALGTPLGTSLPRLRPPPPSPTSRFSQWHASFPVSPAHDPAHHRSVLRPLVLTPRPVSGAPVLPPTPAQLSVHWLVRAGGGVARAGAGRPPSCASRNLIPLLRPIVRASRWHSLAAAQLDPSPAAPLPQAGVRLSPSPLGQVRPPRGVTRLPRGR